MIVFIIFIAITAISLIIAFIGVVCAWDRIIQIALIVAPTSLIIGALWGLCQACISTYSNEPTALDVYRDKTTLEIIYRDSVAVDSTVVYKMK